MAKKMLKKERTPKMMSASSYFYWRPQGDSNPCCRRERQGIQFCKSPVFLQLFEIPKLQMYSCVTLCTPVTLISEKSTPKGTPPIITLPSQIPLNNYYHLKKFNSL